MKRTLLLLCCLPTSTCVNEDWRRAINLLLSSDQFDAHGLSEIFLSRDREPNETMRMLKIIGKGSPGSHPFDLASLVDPIEPPDLHKMFERCTWDGVSLAVLTTERIRALATLLRYSLPANFPPLSYLRLEQVGTRIIVTDCHVFQMAEATA